MLCRMIVRKGCGIIPERGEKAGLNRWRCGLQCSHNRGSASPGGSSEAKMVLPSYPDLGQGGRPLLVLADPSLDEAMLRRHLTLDEVIIFIRSNSQERLIAEGTSGSWWRSYSLVKRAWVMHWNIHYRAHNKTVCGPRQGTKVPRGRKMNNKAEEHSKVGSSVSNNQVYCSSKIDFLNGQSALRPLEVLLSNAY